MKALLAFILGLGVTIGGIFSLEFWCAHKIKELKPGKIDFAKFNSVEELKKLYPEGIFPDPPASLPPERRYKGSQYNVIRPKHEIQFHKNPDLHPESHRHLIKSPDGKVLANVLMSFDKYKRRITPSSDKKKTTQFVAFFGDSNINGFGLSPENTLAQHLSEKMPQTKVYDYSGIALYPYEILKRTENIDRKEEIREAEGVALYFHFFYHIFRNMGGIHELGNQGNSRIKRRVDINENGDVVIGKTFKEERPVSYYFAPYLTKSAIVRYFKLDFIPKDRDYEIHTAIIKQMRRNLAARGINKFFVVIHPMNYSTELTQRLLPFLSKEKIPFIYLVHWKLKELTEGPITLVYDHHISGEANKVIAGGLHQVLSQILPQVTK